MVGLFRKKPKVIKYRIDIVSQQGRIKSKKDPDILLKEATAIKKAGDIEGAIKYLKEAYREISKGSTTYTIKTYLRLPLYLQEAKRNDEAWHEFNVLLTKGYPNQIRAPEIIPMERSAIYDKMRLFLQREGKNKQAIRFGIFSYFSWAIGLYKQKRYDELKRYTSKEIIKKTAQKLLKNTKKEESLELICEVMEKYIKIIPNIKFKELGKKIDEIIFK